ncbi:hypothetical protein PLICRDRAFT_29709 [Plicaturopsis crispa FD-325 SS-3]|nr:hypothetical protein PLICRDRAFT_29709 [Plicaturopsis crispa FD-325 SS-3]
MAHFISSEDVYYRLDNGEVPRGFVKTVGGVRWVGSFETWQTVPEDALSYKDEGVSDSAVNHCGTRAAREWGRDPDWYSRGTYWRGFIPCPSSVSPLHSLWFYNFDKDMPYVQVLFDDSNPNDTRLGFQLPFREQAEMISSLERAYACVAAFVSAFKVLPEIIANRPLDFQTFRLRGVHLEIEGLLRTYGIARRTVLDHLGFASWLMHLYPDWREKVPQEVIACMEEWRVEESPRRGFLVDLTRDWREINLPFWIKHGVPTFWMWGDTEDSEPRFARLSPATFAVTDYDRYPEQQPVIGSTHVPPPVIYTAPPADTDPYRYDKYLSLRHFDTRGGTPMPNRRKGAIQHYVIDFDEWRRRPVTKPQQKALFRKVFFQDTYVRGHVARIYYRARIIVGPPNDINDDEDMSEGEVESELDAEDWREEQVRLRENLRFNYAPWTDQMINQETGSTWRGTSERVTPAGPPRPRSAQSPPMSAVYDLTRRPERYGSGTAGTTTPSYEDDDEVAPPSLVDSADNDVARLNAHASAMAELRRD